MGKTYFVLSVVFFVVAIGFTVVPIITNYEIDRDINGWKIRAQVSSEPNDMHLYMSNVERGMKAWGMTTGYAALIYKTPENDMSLIYHTVVKHVDQAKILTTMNSASPEYQVGLENLSQSIGKLDLKAFSFWSVNEGLSIGIVCIIGWIAFLIFVVCWLKS